MNIFQTIIVSRLYLDQQIMEYVPKDNNKLIPQIHELYRVLEYTQGNHGVECIMYNRIPYGLDN